MSKNVNSPICTLCLDTFTKPKILPCFHTYCEDCLKGLVSRKNQKTFSCPSCRKTVAVPSGGVSAFQTNFYIQTAEETEEPKKPGCKTHPGKELVAFCLSCDLPVCVRCVLGDHKLHDVQDVAETVPKVRQRLSATKAQLRECIDSVTAHLVEELNLQQALKERKADAEWDIRKRHDVLVAAVGRLRDKALEELSQLTGELENEQTDSVAGLQKKYEDLQRLEERVSTALGKADIDLLIAAKEVDIKHGLSLTDVDTVASQETEFWNTMAYRSKEVFGKVSMHMFRFLGYTVAQSTAPAVFKEVYIQKRFQCPGDQVHCVCPCENGEVWVSYEHSDAPIQKFSPQGRLLGTRKNITGKVTIKNCSDGKTFCTVARGPKTQTYSKSNRLLILDNGLHGKAEVSRLDVEKWRLVPLFTIVCGPHLSFDCNDDETLFAVLVQETFVTAERSVQIYRRNRSTPVFTLTPKSFRPSDVCFYGCGDREVLLVAEETNRCVQMFVWRNGVLSFCGTLADVSLFAVTPTALATDLRGNVWIGSRQGLVISCDVTPDMFQTLPDQRNEGHVEMVNISLWYPFIPNTANSSTSNASSNTSGHQQPLPTTAATTTLSADKNLVNDEDKSSSASIRESTKPGESTVVVEENGKQRRRQKKAEPRPEDLVHQGRPKESPSDGNNLNLAALSPRPPSLLPPVPPSPLSSAMMLPPFSLFDELQPTSSSESALSTPTSLPQFPPPISEEAHSRPSARSLWHTTASLANPVLSSTGQAFTNLFQDFSGEEQLLASKFSASSPSQQDRPVHPVSRDSPLSLFEEFAAVPSIFRDSPVFLFDETHASSPSQQDRPVHIASRDSPLSLFEESAAVSSIFRDSPVSLFDETHASSTFPHQESVRKKPLSPALFADSPESLFWETLAPPMLSQLVSHSVRKPDKTVLFDDSPESLFEDLLSVTTRAHPNSRSESREFSKPALFAEPPESLSEEPLAFSTLPSAAPPSVSRKSKRTAPLAGSLVPPLKGPPAPSTFPHAAQGLVGRNSRPPVLSADPPESSLLLEPLSSGSCIAPHSPLFSSWLESPLFGESSSAVRPEPCLFLDSPPNSAPRPVVTSPGLCPP